MNSSKFAPMFIFKKYRVGPKLRKPRTKLALSPALYTNMNAHMLQALLEHILAH